MNCISIVIAGRHPVLLEGLRSVLGPHEDFEIVASCGGSASLVRAIEELAPDIAIVDNCACNVTEVQIIAAIAKSSTKLVLLTGAKGTHELSSLAATDICSLVPKEATPETLVAFLRQLVADREQTVVVLSEKGSNPVQDGGVLTKDMEAMLTDREREIMGLVSEGLSNKAIARRLQLSDGTIKVHLHNIFQKLEIDNRTLLAALAITRQR